jgi:hypothetical protein
VSSARKDGREKGSKSRNGKDKELVDGKRRSAVKVEGVYNRKEKETFKERKQ